jgi:hypothetical protein
MPATNAATVFDWFFDKTAAEWRLWNSSVPAASIADDAKFSDIFIPTVDSVRYTFLLDLAVRHHQPFLFVGPTGDGLLLSPAVVLALDTVYTNIRPTKKYHSDTRTEIRVRSDDMHVSPRCGQYCRNRQDDLREALPAVCLARSRVGSSFPDTLC